MAVPIFKPGEFLSVTVALGSYYPGPGFYFNSFSYRSINGFVPIDLEGASLPIKSPY